MKGLPLTEQMVLLSENYANNVVLLDPVLSRLSNAEQKSVKDTVQLAFLSGISIMSDAMVKNDGHKDMTAQNWQQSVIEASRRLGGITVSAKTGIPP